MFIHELEGWPGLSWDEERVAGLLGSVRLRQGRLLGRMELFGFHQQQETVLRTLTEDVVKTSDIEGETLDPAQVRSSLALRLGLDAGGIKVNDRNVDGIVDVMLDATRNHDQPVTRERLFVWHRSLFPARRAGIRHMRVGAWRDGPMQVVSGPVGRERVHYEAPPAAGLEAEMGTFLDWFNQPDGPNTDGLLKSALAHLWFVTIHPFDDGNGRIARALSDLLLARSEQSPQRFYSMSAQIRLERGAYYQILERTQKDTLNVTPWMEWFLACLGRSIEAADTTLAAVLRKARFWQSLRDVPMNDRQRRVLNRLAEDFEGPLTTSKWAKLARCSADTALRDITDLVERGVLARNSGGGRSTSYALVEERTTTTIPAERRRP